ncbi:hypothetical protein AB5J62_40995 [Amycolatopsis sp. cg5]|uniref:hypothetical protein n=1 Tax=Amycolatopsis sp. cg5 TaxID=3238802 RepID=UPI003525E6C6
MQKNTRLTRRVLMAATAVAACGAIAVTGVLSANAAEQPTGVATAGEAPAADKVFAPAEAPAAAPEAPESKPVGDVISTGIKDAKGEVVFYAVAVTEPSLPNTHFGIMKGHRGADGKLTADTVANEFNGSDKAPGFHAVSVGNNGGGAFGYYAGPAAKITAKGAEAHTAKWSEDPDIVVFWFDKVTEPSGLKAVDAAGKALPAGNTQPGRG